MDGSGADTSFTNLTISMPKVIDVSGLTAMLFGQAGTTLEGALIPVTDELSRASLYESSSAWIHYIQDASENNFRALINKVKADALFLDLSGCVNLGAGKTYSATSQTNPLGQSPAVACDALDIAQAAPFSSYTAPWAKYNSVQDMVVSYFAIKILGHPGALAAISNDSVLRAGASMAVEGGFAQIFGDSDVACVDASGLTDFESKAAANTAAAYNHTTAVAPYIPMNTAGVPKPLSETDVLTIVETMMNLDPVRFSTRDKNVWQPLYWKQGDKLRFQLKLSNNKYTVKAGGKNFLTPESGAPAVAAINDVPGDAVLNYQLEFTVGA